MPEQMSSAYALIQQTEKLVVTDIKLQQLQQQHQQLQQEAQRLKGLADGLTKERDSAKKAADSLGNQVAQVQMDLLEDDTVRAKATAMVHIMGLLKTDDLADAVAHLEVLLEVPRKRPTPKKS
jgi:hypothetical protein